MQRASLVGRGVRGVDHQLLPQRKTVLVGAGQLVRGRQQLPVALAHPHALERHQRLAQQLAELRQDPRDPLARAHRDDHHRHLARCAAKNRARARRPPRVPSTPSSAVAPAIAAAVQKLADGHERRRVRRALPASHVDGQLGRLARAPSGSSTAPTSPLSSRRARSSVISPRRLIASTLLEQRLDPLARVDRDRHHRQIFGQRQQPVGAQVVQPPEALGAAQQHARLHAHARRRCPSSSSAEQPVGRAVALAEVRRELQAVLVHALRSDRVPERGRADADREAEHDVDDRASRASPSSARRWVSSIHVENVV